MIEDLLECSLHFTKNAVDGFLHCSFHFILDYVFDCLLDVGIADDVFDLFGDEVLQLNLVRNVVRVWLFGGSGLEAMM